MTFDTATATIAGLYRYPVKGLTPEGLMRVRLTPGETLPADRRYAIQSVPFAFDPKAPVYAPKSRFLMLMRNDRLARLRTRYDETTHVLSVSENGAEAVRGDLTTQDGRAAVEAFFTRYCAGELRGAPKVLSAPGFSFSDVAAKVVSIINLASVADIGNKLGAGLDPLRFRGNVHASGWPAWSEFDLLGRDVVLGGARVRIVKRIQRCAAVNVDPSSGNRDLQIPDLLMREFGHADCGVYAEVIAGGDVAIGDAITADRGLPF